MPCVIPSCLSLLFQECFFFLTECRKKRLRLKRKGQAAMSEERTVCGLDLERREPSASGARGLGRELIPKGK
jgi:hypothetical protein